MSILRSIVIITKCNIERWLRSVLPPLNVMALVSGDRCPVKLPMRPPLGSEEAPLKILSRSSLDDTRSGGLRKRFFYWLVLFCLASTANACPGSTLGPRGVSEPQNALHIHARRRGNYLNCSNIATAFKFKWNKSMSYTEVTIKLR